MSKLKNIAVRLDEDIKNSKGLWLRSYTEVTSHVEQTQYHTRAGTIYGRLSQRCRQNSAYVKGKPSYRLCENKFQDFQEFAEWCQSQYGYMHKETNLNQFWSLDKDILIAGNKVYSPDTCIFVPNSLNALFSYNQINKGGCPIGVDFKRREQKFRASCSDAQGKQRHLGYFDDALEAHKAWQIFKVNIIRNSAKEESFGPLLQKALETRADIIENDYLNNIITEI